MERAVNLAAELEVPAIGGPVGGLSVVQAAEPEQVDRRYDELIQDLGDLTVYAKEAGLEERFIEPTHSSAKFLGMLLALKNFCVT